LTYVTIVRYVVNCQLSLEKQKQITRKLKNMRTFENCAEVNYALPTIDVYRYDPEV